VIEPLFESRTAPVIVAIAAGRPSNISWIAWRAARSSRARRATT
jgi:hypothetical protein